MSPLSLAGLFALGLASYALYRDDKRVSILCLWLAQTAVGAAFLGLGLEFLALTLWTTSTLSALSHFFHALLLGEFVAGSNGPAQPSGGVPKALAAAVVLGFCFLVAYPFIEFQTARTTVAAPEAELALRTWGSLLVEEHWVALVASAALLGAVAMGAGLIARPERDGGSDS